MRLLKDNSLTIILMLLFAGSIVGQWLTGWHVALEDAARHSQPGMSLASYSFSSEFLSSVFENWESEFLQMSAYVVLTAFLIQRGSSESKDPDGPSRDEDLAQQAVEPGAPAILRWGPFARELYARSLGIALGVRAASNERAASGKRCLVRMCVFLIDHMSPSCLVQGS